MFLPVGELWSAYDSESLGLAQVIVERYLYYPLWFDFIVPFVLLQKAAFVLPIGVIGSFFATCFFFKLP